MAVEAGTRTAEDLWGLPDDGLRHELLRGELRTMTPPGAEHGRVAGTISGLLFAHARQTGAGVMFAAETGFLIGRSPDTVRAPDVAFVSAPRAQAAGRVVKFWPGAPDLAVEVVSPGDTFAEVEAKALDWLQAGTLVVVVVDPARRTATTYRAPANVEIHTGDAPLDLSDAVPGWRVELRDFFS